MTAPQRNIIFDVGNVLLAWDPAALVRRWLPPDRQEEFLHGIFLHRNWHELDRGDLDEEDANRLFAERLHHPIEEIRDLVLASKVSLVPMPDSLLLLEELHASGFGLYCITNMARGTWEFVSHRFDFWRRFRDILVSAHVRLTKPEPAIYHRALEQFGIAARDTIFLDDKPENVRGAREIGIEGIVFADASACRDRLLGPAAPEYEPFRR